MTLIDPMAASTATSNMQRINASFGMKASSTTAGPRATVNVMNINKALGETGAQLFCRQSHGTEPTAIRLLINATDEWGQMAAGGCVYLNA